MDPVNLNSNRTGQFAFGPFTFDEAAGELRKHDLRLRLGGQPQQILAMLLRSPGRVVTREEIQQRLWPSGTSVDFEHGLNAAINRLRQALGDSAEQPVYIETLPGKGYRFVSSVREPDAKPVFIPKPAPPEPAGTQNTPGGPAVVENGKRRAWPRIAGALLTLAIPVLYFAGWTWLSPSRIVGPAVQFAIQPPAGYALEPGSSRQTFALSPDGSKLAFSAMDSSGLFHAFIRDLGSLEARPLPQGAGAYHVFWAPDGRSLFFSARGTLHRADISSGAVQAVCDLPAVTLNAVVTGSGLLISDRTANYLVPLAGGTPRKIPEFMPWPQALPDGKGILFTKFDANTGRHRAYVATMESAEAPALLMEGDSRFSYTPSSFHPGKGFLVYLRAGALIAHPFDPRSLRLEGEPAAIGAQTYSFLPTGAADFSVSDNGMLAYRKVASHAQLAWVDRQGRVLRKVGPANAALKFGHVSPDGKRIAVSILDVNRGVKEVWIVNSEPGTSGSGDFRQVDLGQGSIENPIWDPGGRRLAFARALETFPKLFVRSVNEDVPEIRFPSDVEMQVPTDWSSDGRFLLVTNTGFARTENERQGDIMAADLKRGQLTPLIRTRFHEANASFSPDGRWIAFTSNDSGRPEVYVQAFDGSGAQARVTGERYLVSRMGAVAVRWRRDGKELFYLAFNGEVHSVLLTLSGTVKTGEARRLFPIGAEARAALHSMPGFDVSPDGQRFLIPMVESEERPEIVVVQNWEAGLQERGAR